MQPNHSGPAKLFHLILQLISHAAKDHVSVYAASASFFLSLSLLPALMLTTALLHLTPLREAHLLDAIASIVPAAFLPLLQTILAQIFQFNSLTVISVTALLAVWSASRGVLGVMVGVNAIFHCQDARGFLMRRFLCILYMLLLIPALFCMLALHVFGRHLLALLAQVLPISSILLSFARFIISAILLTAVFTAIYLVFPNRRVRFRACLPAAFAAAVGWLVFSSLFSLYAASARSYTTFYGSLSAIALFLLWLYFCMTILLYGGVLASMLDPDAGQTPHLP